LLNLLITEVDLSGLDIELKSPLKTTEIEARQLNDSIQPPDMNDNPQNEGAITLLA
jgi:hypothetical protein